jgi:GntR family transcriptional regulator, transcriptional repressor for pyruvate dehydrogenase complex
MKIEELQPIQEVNRLTFIQERIKEYILANHLRPGDKLPTEEQLAETLRISRSAIREAYRSLEALGIVAVQQGMGRVVREFNFDIILNNLNYGMAFHGHSILHTHGLRKMLEYACIESSIANISEADLVILSKLVEQMREACTISIIEFGKADFEFHRLLFRCCGNPLALQLFEISWRMAETALNSDWGYSEASADLAEDHAQILDAVVRKDVVAARTRILYHFRDFEERLHQLIEQQRQREPVTAPAIFPAA